MALEKSKQFLKDHWMKIASAGIVVVLIFLLYGNIRYLKKSKQSTPTVTEQVVPKDNTDQSLEGNVSIDNFMEIPEYLKPLPDSLPPPKSERPLEDKTRYPIIIGKEEEPAPVIKKKKKIITLQSSPSEPKEDIYGLIKPSKNLDKKWKSHHQLDGEGSTITYFGLQDYVY